MSDLWDSPNELRRLLLDIEDLAVAVRIGRVELSAPDRFRVLCAAAVLAGDMAEGLDPSEVSRGDASA